MKIRIRDKYLEKKENSSFLGCGGVECYRGIDTQYLYIDEENQLKYDKEKELNDMRAKGELLPENFGDNVDPNTPKWPCLGWWYK